jgi:hypothetical protein
MNTFRSTLFALCLLGTLLSGCATSTVLSHVTVFHELSTTPQDVKYAFVRSSHQEGSLEHKAYEQMVREQLNKRGFLEVPVAQANIAVFLSYQIDDGKTVISSYPIFGQTGVAGSQTYGNIYSTSPGTASFSATTTYTPSIGVVGAGDQSDLQYTRKVQLDMLDRQLLDKGTVSKIYEGTVTSVGSSGQLNRVMPYMLRSLFQEFPGRSGTTKDFELRFQAD